MVKLFIFRPQTAGTVLEQSDGSGGRGVSDWEVYLVHGWHHHTKMHQARRYLHLWESEPGRAVPVLFRRFLPFFSPGRNSVAPLCYSRHVHTQMTYLLKCQLRKLCFLWLELSTSWCLHFCSSSAGCSFALIFPSPATPVLTFLSSLCLSVPRPSPGEAFVRVSAEAQASSVQDCTCRLSDAGDRLQDPV